MYKHQSQGTYIHGLSQFGPCLGKMPLGLISFVIDKDHDFGPRLIDTKAKRSEKKII
jgi:hypothetical protein